jgi:hypothetical protein
MTEVEEGKWEFPIGIFPEGTVSNGNAINDFKQGAFINLSPIQPYAFFYPGPLLRYTTEMESFFNNIGFLACVPFHRMKVERMPVFKPTEYMFETFKHLGKSKVEIYKNVMQQVIAEQMNLPISTHSLPQKKEYYERLRSLSRKDKSG